jgi:hypothetical protein
MEVVVRKEHFILVPSVSLQEIESRINHDSPDPGAQFSLLFVLAEVMEHLYKAFLQNILRILHGPGIPVAYAKHMLREFLVEHALRLEFPLKAILYQFLMIHQYLVADNSVRTIVASIISISWRQENAPLVAGRNPGWKYPVILP